MTLGHVVALAMTFIGGIALALYGFRFRDRSPEAHKFPVFGSLSDEVGRAAEEGNLIHITLGHGGLVGEDAMASVAAVEGLTALCDLAAAYDTPPIITVGDPTLYLLADDWMRRAYARLGNAERYRPTLVQFMASSPVTYAAIAATYLYERGVGANVMLGSFDQEVSLISDAAVRQGAFSVGGAVSPEALGALYPALRPSRLAMGEELFAGGAEATQQPAFWASLWAENFLRWIVIASLIVFAVLAVLGVKVI